MKMMMDPLYVNGDLARPVKVAVDQAYGHGEHWTRARSQQQLAAMGLANRALAHLDACFRDNVETSFHKVSECL